MQYMLYLCYVYLSKENIFHYVISEIVERREQAEQTVLHVLDVNHT